MYISGLSDQCTFVYVATWCLVSKMAGKGMYNSVQSPIVGRIGSLVSSHP